LSLNQRWTIDAGIAINLGELGDMRLYQKVTADVTVADIRILKDFVIREYACSQFLELELPAVDSWNWARKDHRFYQYQI
jgi:hypothetical protein